MTDLKDYFSNCINQCSEDCAATTTVETAASVSLISPCTVEDLLAKYLIDFAIEEDNVLGYFNDFNIFSEIVEKMKELGFAFSVRDSDARQKQRQKNKKLFVNNDSNEGIGRNDEFSHLTIFYQLRAMPIKFFGLPFTIDKTTHYQCAYGRKYYKSRANIAKMKSDIFDFKAKKKKRVGSKKMGCLAKMILKHITVYPDYQLDIESDWRKKKKLIENLRKDLSDNGKAVSQFQRYYLSVSLQSSHNHPPIITKPKLKIPKPKLDDLLIKRGSSNKTSVNAEPKPHSTVLNENDWNYLELASSSLNIEQGVIEEIPVKSLNLKNDSFLGTLLKFPNTTSTLFEPINYKPSEIEIEIKSLESVENIPTIEVYEYQPTLEDLQTLFKEKLKNLYMLCNNCSNSSLILRLASDLEQVELQLSNDVNFNHLQ